MAVTSETSTRVALQRALRRLAASPSTAALRAEAPRELCTACGLSRAMVSAVSGSRWVPLVLFTRDDLDPAAAEFRAFVAGDAEIPLANMLAETEIVRRRVAVRIDDAQLDRRTFKPIIELAGSAGYVAAPILLDGRVAGFVHADRVGQERGVGEEDRRSIQAFAGELSVLHQRLGWAERLADRRRGVADEVERATATLNALASASDDLGVTHGGVGARAASVGGGAPRRDALLTLREREVLDLVAEGATNARVAEHLSLSEDTVKSHMRSVLRKLRVTSRAAAVARYLRLEGPGRA